MPRPKKQHLTRRKDGRYCCKYHGIQFMGNTEEEALRARDEYKEAERQGMQTALRPITLYEYAIKWLPVHFVSVKASTYNGYVSIIEHTLSDLKSKYLDEITSDDVSEALAKLAGKSQSYIHKARILLIAMLDSAMDAGYITKNPARTRSVRPPRGTVGTHRAITQEERDLIRNTPHRVGVLAAVMITKNKEANDRWSYGYSAGYDKGYEEGEIAGYDKGFDDGCDFVREDYEE